MMVWGLLWGITTALAWNPPLPSVEKVKSGIEVHWYRRLNDPLTEIGWIVTGGAKTDPAGKSGLSELACLALARKITAQIENLGAHATCRADADQFEIRVVGFGRDSAALLSVLVSVFAKPDWTDSEWTGYRQLRQETFFHRVDQPESLGTIWMHRLLWKGTPYEWAFAGKNEDLSRLVSSDLQVFQARPDRYRVWIITPMDAANLRPILETLAPPSSFPVAKSGNFTFSSMPLAIQVIDRSSSGQALFQYGIRIRSPDRAALSVFNAILGDGFQSRLTSELRDEKGFVYSISSRIAFLEEGAQMIVEGAAPASLAGPVHQEIQRIIRGFENQPPTASELNAARDYLRGRFFLSLASPAEIAEYRASEIRMGDLGRAYDQIDSARLQALLESDFRKREWVSVWVGSASEITKSLTAKGYKTSTVLSPAEVLSGTSPQKSPQKRSRSSAKSNPQKRGR